MKSPTGLWTRWVGVAIGLTAAITTVLLVRPLWIANDDSVMAAISSGQYTGDPSSELVFVNRLLGGLLSQLNHLTQTVPWYGIAVIAMAALSISLTSIYCKNLLALMAWSSVAIPLIVLVTAQPSFTITAMLCSGAGLVLVSGGLLQLSGKHTIPLGLSFLVLGFLWRKDAAILSLILMLPFLGYSMIEFWRRSKRHERRFLVLLLAGTLLLLLTVTQLDVSCLFRSQCEAWQQFDRYNAIRGSIQGTPRLNAGLGSEGLWGWTPGAMNIFNYSAYPDSSIFGVDALSAMNNAIPQILRFPGNTFTSVIPELATRLYPLLASIIAILLLVGISIITTARDRQSALIRLLLLTITLWMGALLTLSTLRLSEPTLRGAVVVLFFATWIGFFVFGSQFDHVDASKSRSNGQQTLLICIVGGMVAISVTQLCTGQFAISRLAENSNSAFNARDSIRNDIQDLVGSHRSFSGGAVDVFNPQPLELFGPSVVGPLTGGWTVFSPLYSERAKTLGFSDVYLDLYNGAASPQGDESVYFIGSESLARDTAALLHDQLGYPNEIVPVSLGKVIGLSTEAGYQDNVWQFIKAESQ